MAQVRAPFWKRHRWLKWTAGALLLGLVALAVVFTVLAHRVEPYLRARIVDELHTHFHARVELDSFHIDLANGLWAEGKGLRIWPPAQVAGVAVPGPGEPLIQLDAFRFHAPLHYQPGQTIHIPVVELKGLHVSLPPKSHFGRPATLAEQPRAAALVSFDVDRFECDRAQLVLETSKPGKLPLTFAIAHFKLTNVSSSGAMGFDAELTNPRPVGTIHSTGHFGPWQVDDPGESPIDGNYRFDHADLSGFKGIAGILTSKGHYQGTLRDLAVDGEADVPDFRLTHFGNAMPLQARFHARVDATNGDTWLEPVDATLGRSHFTAKGPIVRVPASKAPGAPSVGHDIALKINVDRARIEDFLRLASGSPTPLLTGDVTVNADLHIPPGPAPMHQRMTLAGKFLLDQARFTSDKIQDRIEEMSLRGQGRPNDLKTTDPETVHSTMRGNFQLAGGVVNLPSLKYTVPGADIQLKGSYGTEEGSLDFAGTVKLEATVSQMVGGWKGLLLKPADRFFQKNGAGTEIPIAIQGTRDDPKFVIEFGKMKAGQIEQR